MQPRNLNFLESSGLFQACNGITLQRDGLHQNIHSYSKARVINKFKNLKHKVQKCNANIRYNKQYLSTNIIPNYVDGDTHYYHYRFTHEWRYTSNPLVGLRDVKGDKFTVNCLQCLRLPGALHTRIVSPAPGNNVR